MHGKQNSKIKEANSHGAKFFKVKARVKSLYDIFPELMFISQKISCFKQDSSEIMLENLLLKELNNEHIILFHISLFMTLWAFYNGLTYFACFVCDQLPPYNLTFSMISNYQHFSLILIHFSHFDTFLYALTLMSYFLIFS